MLTGFCSHKYQQLPLIDEDDFLTQHPEHSDLDKAALMIARIDHEKAEREALEAQRQELLKRKQKLIAENKKRKDDLANLDKDLEKFIDVRLSRLFLLASDTDSDSQAAKPIQKLFEKVV
jgi:THO complex subunit 5